MVSIALLDISFSSFTVFLIWLTMFSYISLYFFEDHSKFFVRTFTDLHFFRVSYWSFFFSFFPLVMTCFLDYSWSLWSCVGICAFEVRGNSSYLHWLASAGKTFHWSVHTEILQGPLNGIFSMQVWCLVSKWTTGTSLVPGSAGAHLKLYFWILLMKIH